MGVRIGCASAFYGDSQLAARQLVDKGDIKYLVFDYLAEATMAILARAALKNPELGYAVDFVNVAMRDVLQDCAKKGIKVVANAGGVNVPGCIKALEALCDDLNLNLQVAGVFGDNLADKMAELPVDEMSEMQTGAALPKQLASINAYFGAVPIAEALAAGADIVVTGRVVDSAVVLGPLIYEHGWSTADYDQLAQGSLAGHVIECGAQCTGGNFTDWQDVPDFSNISYPVAEVEENGDFVISIPPETGGIATIGTVAEQIVYEIGDPANYLLPDVACDFSNVKLKEIDTDQVLVTGARGRAPGPNYKVCATWMDGFRLAGTFYMAGPRSAQKADTSLNAWVERTRRVFKQKGLEDYRRVSIEIAGAESIYGPHGRQPDSREVMGKFGLHHNSKEALVFASMEMAYLATSGPPAMSGFAAGRARPQPLMRVHSCLLNKERVSAKVVLGDSLISDQTYPTPSSEPVSQPSGAKFLESQINALTKMVSLESLAYARSGDKGDNANIGVICRKPEYLPFLYTQLTAERIADYFSHLIEGQVQRFYMPGIHAFNFFLTEALGGGGTASLRLDAQAKTYAQMLMSLEIEVPENLLVS